MKRFKTTGYTWLEHSLIAFNGSGYADRSSAEAFLDSYRAYKTMKRDGRALSILEQHWFDALAPAFDLVTTSLGPDHTPAEGRLKEFKKYYNPKHK